MEFIDTKYWRLRKVLEFFSSLRIAAFLLLCLLLGGTSQDIVPPKLVLYLTSIFIIGFCLTSKEAGRNLKQFKSMFVLLGLFLLGHIFYLLPLPSNIWSALPGRELIAEGYRTIGADLPWLPMSLTPEKTFFSLFDFLPPIAMLLMMTRVDNIKAIELTVRMLALFTIFSVILGVLQVSNVGDLHFYEITNDNSAVGFFSNANHMGVFLLMIIPLVMSLPSFLNDRYYETSRRAFVLSIVCILSALLGIGLTGSLGGFLLILPVLAATVFIWKSGEGRSSIYLIGVLVSLVAAFLFDMFVWENLQSEALDKISTTHATDRQTMFANTFNLAKTYFPFGTGPGSFSDVYKLAETATPKTIPHAHNEYVELLLEFGILSIAWIVVTFFWLLKTIRKSFAASGLYGQIPKYFSVVTMVVLTHSLFDYSLRTISIMTLLVFCLCVSVLFCADDNLSETS